MGTQMDLKKDYTEALRHFLDKRDESARERAFEMGRQALSNGASLLEVVTVHHDVLAGLSSKATEADTLRLAGEFLREILGSFEMIYRGYKEMVGVLKERADELDQANRKLKELNESLERRVAERSKAAEEKSLALARSNAELQQFVHVSSHDLKEPLRTITSYVQLLQKKYQSQLGPESEEYVRFVVEGTHRLQELIDDLMSYTRLEDRGRDLEWVDMPKILEEVRTNLKITIQEKKAQITQDPLPRVKGHPAHMVLLFQNLIGNAIKFHGKAPPRIHVGARLEEGKWIFQVTDNGIGIDPKYFEKLFVVFQRLHTREEYPGTGIGLALCRKIVEQWGGTIWVESKPGAGSTFYFTVPASPEPEAKD